jgi:hypothetical protein
MDTYHGAKNSTKINGSGLTKDWKVEAVRLMTSSASSATAVEAQARSTATTVEKNVKRMVVGVGKLLKFGRIKGELSMLPFVRVKLTNPNYTTVTLIHPNYATVTLVRYSID